MRTAARRVARPSSGPSPTGPTCPSCRSTSPRSSSSGYWATPNPRFPGDPSAWWRCFVGHMPPACSLLSPCQTNGLPGNRPSSSFEARFVGRASQRRADIELADRDAVERVLKRLADRGYPMRAMIRGVVTSDPFRRQ
ncbi:MAG TPA: DUF1585 domain-containing protein [Acidobacteria bacterium]|nr:DUF1585 domain-containing protein [Acidobacteriota bacterium]